MKQLKLTLLTITSLSLLAVISATSISSANQIKAGGTEHSSNCYWNHYEEIAPTYDNPGVREYWICCNHHQDGPVFVRPTTGIIHENTHPTNFVNTLSSSDDRYMNPYKETVTFDNSVIPSFISIFKNANPLEIVDNEGIDSSKCLKIVNNSWNYGIKFSNYYLDQVFSNPNVKALNFYAKSNVATNDFRRLSNGSGVCYELNNTGYGITNEWKEFSYTREYYERDVATDCIIYGGVASGTSIYIDNIHPVMSPLTSNGFENVTIKENTDGGFRCYTPGHSSVGIDNYIATTTHLFALPGSAGVITSYGFDYNRKTEGIRSLRFTKTNGYVALYLPQEIYQNLGDDDFVSIDVYSTMNIDSGETANQICDGFTNTNLKSKKANEWETYSFAKSKNITNDGRFLILQGGCVGDICLDNIRVNNRSEDEEYKTGDIYTKNSDTYINFETRKKVDTIVGVTVDSNVVVPINNTRYVFVSGEKTIGIKKTQITNGTHMVSVSYISDGLMYKETRYMNIVEVTENEAKSVSIAYGDADYYTLSGYSDIYRIECGNKEVPFEVSGANLLIPNSVLVELLPTENNAKVSGVITLVLKSIGNTYFQPMNITVTGTNVVKPELSFGDKEIKMHAYSSSSSLASNVNYVPYINDYRVSEYKNTGLNIWYEQAMHVGQSVSELSQGIKELLRIAKNQDLKVMLSDDTFTALSRSTTSLYGQTISYCGKTKVVNTEADLDEIVETRLRMYINEPAVYGVSVGDEQNYEQLCGGFADLLPSIHRVLNKLNRNDFYINVNLVPMSAGKLFLTGEGTNDQPNYSTYVSTEMAGMMADYETYLRKYVEVSGNNYIQYDLYPFTSSDKGWKYETKGLDIYTLQNLLIAAKICKEYDLELKVVTQSLMYYGTREISPLDIAWMNNMLLAFGVKHISYFVYQCRANTGTEAWQETSSFLNIAGDKNPMYYYMQGMISQIKNFQNVIMDFDYEWSNLYRYALSYNKSTMYSAGKAIMGQYYDSTYGDLSSVTTSKDWTLVTGLKNQNNPNQYMYAVENVYNSFSSDVLQTVKLTFTKSFAYAIVYENGVRRIVNMNSKTLSLKLSAGHTAFVIPCN